MKHIFPALLSVALFFIGLPAFAQAPEQDCINGIYVCGSFYTQINSYTGTGTYPAELTIANQGCLGSGEKNDVWYIVNVSTAGTLELTLTPVNLANDYDFAVWDITNVGCQAIYNYTTNTANAYLPIGCNYSGTPGATGLSNTITGAQWSPALNVTPGMTLAINVSNFSSTAAGYTLDFTPSTASVFDTVKPKFLNVKSACQFAGSTLTVKMTEAINCASIAANGSQFYITPAPVPTVISATGVNCTPSATSTTTLIDLQLSGILPAGTYWLHSQAGTGGALSDPCGNVQTTPGTSADSIQFTLVDAAPPKLLLVDTPACKKARVHFNRSIRAGTVATNGSDFLITGPSQVNVIAAKALDTTAGGLADSVDIDFDRSILVPGTYTLSVRIGTDTNSITDTCSLGVDNTVSFVVSDQGFVTAVASPPVLCEPGYTQLSATLTADPLAVLPGYTWTYSNYLGDSTAASTLAFVPQTSRYTIQIMDTSFCYRRFSSEVIVSVRHPQLLSNDTDICIGFGQQLNIGGGVAYQWFPATGLSCTTCSNPIASPTTTTTYYGVIFDQYNCSDTVQTTITVHPLPYLNAGRDTTITYGQPIQLYAFSPGGKYYLWDPIIGLNNANIPDPIANPPYTTTYVVNVIDTNQCYMKDTIKVTVRTDIPVQVPSGFTPNHDGKNDVFKVANLSFQRVIEFRVFNRWGQEVYNAVDNKGWDGTVSGKDQDAGVYQYIIRISYPDGHNESFKGDVTLVR